MYCVNADCLSDARWLVFWPGQSSPMCTPCSLRAFGIAQAMGFVLPAQPIEDSAAWLAAAKDAAACLSRVSLGVDG